jgi:hypothetical protein
MLLCPVRRVPAVGCMAILGCAGHELRKISGRFHELRAGLNFPEAFRLTEAIRTADDVLHCVRKFGGC